MYRLYRKKELDIYSYFSNQFLDKLYATKCTIFSISTYKKFLNPYQYSQVKLVQDKIISIQSVLIISILSGDTAYPSIVYANKMAARITTARIHMITKRQFIKDFIRFLRDLRFFSSFVSPLSFRWWW